MLQTSNETCLQKLQHRLANFRSHASLQQLVLQSHWLTQVGVRLTQNVVQV